MARHKTEAPAAPPPIHASLQPFATIPAEPLGFAAPGDFYMGTRSALVSLDFLDEDHLLFTFRVPGLFHREANGATNAYERHIRALVLHIPDGAVQSEELWTLHDRSRYLYMLEDGKFLLRDRNTLQEGDVSLQLRPYLRFPGALLAVELDPSRQYLVASSDEPVAESQKSANVDSPDTAQAAVTTDGESKPGTVLRILRRSSGQVLLVSRVRSVAHLPMNENGYLEPLRASGTQWILNLDYFTGGSTRVGAVDSVCAPTFYFLSPTTFLTSTCDMNGGRTIVAMTLDGRRLWQATGSETTVWPNFLPSRSGTRLAVETLRANHAVNASTPLSGDDIVSQDVMIYDTANGSVALKAQASPIFDAGGNVALSPSGRRAAILMDGGIQVFDLSGPVAAH